MKSRCSTILIAVLIMMFVFNGPGSYKVLAISECEIIADEIAYCKTVSEIEKTNTLEVFNNTSNRLLIVSRTEPMLNGIKGVRYAIYDGKEFGIIQFYTIQNAISAKELLEQQYDVESVEYDYVVNACSSKAYQESNNPVVKNMSWGTSYIGADTYAEYLKGTNYKKQTIAVVDTGIDYNHPSLKPRIVSGYDLVNNDKDPMDDEGHGTHVAGIIVDCTRDIDKIDIMPIKVLDNNGEGDNSTIANGIQYAIESKVSVINISLGGTHSNYLDAMVNRAVKSGITVVIAAGNDGRLIVKSKDCPAHIMNAVVVGSVNQRGNISYFSNYGDAVDVMAPGEEIYSTYLENQYCVFDGTSMACPYASASIAMLRAHYEASSNEIVDSLIARGCDAIVSYDNTNRKTGKGIINLNNMFMDVSMCPTTKTKDLEYSGKSVAPNVKLTFNSEPLIENTDYAVEYGKTIKVGKYTAKITGIGTYYGEKTVAFNIVPKKSSVSKLTAGKKKLTVKMGSKVSSTGGSYYKVQYRVKGTSSWKTKTTSSQTITLKSLKKGKAYQVRVCAYKKVSGRTYTGSWSSIKTSKKVK